MLHTTLPTQPSRKERSLLYFLKRDWQLYALVAVPMAFVLIFKYGSYFGLQIAFEDFKFGRGFANAPWNNFAHFNYIFSHREFVPALRNTLMLNVLDLLIGFPVPIILALLLNEIRQPLYKRVTQTVMYLPYFLSWVIIGALAYQLFSLQNGLINQLIRQAGGTAVPFLQQNTNWLISYVLIGVWQGMGWGTIIYLAAITSVSPELYEAATLDGAGRFQRIWHVTLPCIRGTIITLLIMNLGKLMQGSFERVLALENKAAPEFAKTIPVLVYRWGLYSSNPLPGPATALGLFQSVVGLVLVVGANFVVKQFGEDGLF